MTVAEFINELSKYPPNMKVGVFCPFDGNGPCEWETPVIFEDDGELHIDSSDGF